MSPIRFLVLTLLLAAAATFLPATAAAEQPTVELQPVDIVQVLSGADSPCPFDTRSPAPALSRAPPTTTTPAHRSGRASTVR
jgi:hypothetical protein